jgi:hypothetical protein
MLMTGRIEHRRLRAPQDSGSALIEPPLASFAELLAGNRAQLSDESCDIGGRSRRELAATARSELIARAVAYTAQYRDVDAGAYDPAAPVLLAGHQPQMFHPGVWFKNFALSHLAQRQGATGVNLLIDSDTIKTASIAVPTGSKESPRREFVAFDAAGPDMPYEERRVLNAEQFDGFARRVCGQMIDFGGEPIVDEYWPLAVERRRAGANLGECLAQARHQLERAWGGQTLELPQSQVCSLESFFWFSAHLLSEHARVWRTYNEALAEYRAAHGLRNDAQPVPDLDRREGWFEVPFWVWTADEPNRRPLYVQSQGAQLILSDRTGWKVSLQADSAGRLAEALTNAADSGLKIRTRALSTTLFARLLLGDVFLHGIGGAKYDQVTDVLLHRLFGVAPPQLVTVSATLRLPSDRPAITLAEGRRIDQMLRELSYHPERHVDLSQAGDRQQRAIDALIATKQRWIATAKTPENAAERHREINRVNAELHTAVAAQRRSLEEARRQWRAQYRAELVLSSREYAFCLHSKEKLHELILEFLPASA